MAKSIRSKVKMAARRKKRESGNYAAADAARVARLSAKLLKKDKAEPEVKQDEDEVMEADAEPELDIEADQEEKPKKLSTSGPRDSRRQRWRESKGRLLKTTKRDAMGLGGGKRSFKPKRRR